MGGPTDAVDDELKPDFKEWALGALENADIRPGKDMQDQQENWSMTPLDK